MVLENILNLKLAIEGPWYKEYSMVLMVPAFTTLACWFVPLFHCEKGLSSMAVIPLMAAFSYGHTLAPRKECYEKDWKKLLDYPSFILSSIKKALLFSVPTGVAGWITSLFLSGFPKELAKFFEVATWGLLSGICLHAFMTYVKEVYKLRKTNKEEFKIKMAILWKWIAPPSIGSLLLLLSKVYFF